MKTGKNNLYFFGNPFSIKTNYLVIIPFLFLFFLSCNVNNNDDDQLDGYTIRDPIIGFAKYYLVYDKKFNLYVYTTKVIDSLSMKDTVFISVTEFNRSDGKPCPAKGSELTILLKTKSGDYETFKLDSELNLRYPDNVTGYAKILPIKYTAQHYPFNGILEINTIGDGIYAEYHSWWNGDVVNDTLFFQP